MAAMAVARALMITVGGLTVMWVLVTLGDAGLAGSVGRVPADLRTKLLVDGLTVTGEVALVGTIISGLVGAGLGLAARSSAGADRLLGVLAVLGSGLMAPVVTVTLIYWLLIRWGLAEFGWISFRDDPVGHARALIIPVLTLVAVLVLPIASSVRDTVTPWRPRPVGIDAVAAPVANRSAPMAPRLIGFPAGSLLLALASIDLLLGTPGFFRALVNAVAVGDTKTLMLFSAPVVVVGAIMAWSVDLVSLRFGGARFGGARFAAAEQESGAAPSGGPAAWGGLMIGGVMLASVMVLAVVGLVTGSPDQDLTAAHRGWLDEGHLLGTDLLGRDVLHLMVHAAWPTVVTALLPALVAVGVAALVELSGRALSSAGSAVLNVVVDLAWWPGLVVLLAATLPFGWSGPISAVHLALLAVALVPTATRLVAHQRAGSSGGAAGWLGVVALMTGAAVGVLAMAGLLTGNLSNATWGSLLGRGRVDLALDARLAVVPAVALTWFLTAVNLVGASLLALGRRRPDGARPAPAASPTPAIPVYQPPTAKRG